MGLRDELRSRSGLKHLLGPLGARHRARHEREAAMKERDALARAAYSNYPASLAVD
jgi:hypothetical protein